LQLVFVSKKGRSLIFCRLSYPHNIFAGCHVGYIITLTDCNTWEIRYCKFWRERRGLCFKDTFQSL